jgi:hypothetical protein
LTPAALKLRGLRFACPLPQPARARSAAELFLWRSFG